METDNDAGECYELGKQKTGIDQLDLPRRERAAKHLPLGR